MTSAVLVTGGFGLVGSETVKQLTAAGRAVVVADLVQAFGHRLIDQMIEHHGRIADMVEQRRYAIGK